MAQNIKAVHDDDLNNLLENLGLLAKFNSGQIKCAFCGDVVNFGNLHSLFHHGGIIKMSCSKPVCVMSMMSKLEEKKYE